MVCCVSGWQRLVCYLDNINHFLFNDHAFRPLCDLHDRNLTACLMTHEIDGVPQRLLDLYIERAMEETRAEEYEPGKWFAVVDRIGGAWGSGPSLAAARTDLRHGIIGWIEIKRRDADDDIPVLDGIDLNGEIPITITLSSD